jgi:transcriptional regulator with XRE-family HTH domain
MAKKDQYLHDAMTLRMQGKTLKEIEALTGVSKNSLSQWFKEEGVDEIKDMLSSHPLRQVEKLDRKIEKVIDEIYKGDDIPPGKADELAKLMKVRTALAGPGSEEYLRSVITVTGELARFASTYFDEDADRKKIARLLQAFYHKTKKKEI